MRAWAMGKRRARNIAPRDRGANLRRDAAAVSQLRPREAGGGDWWTWRSRMASRDCGAALLRTHFPEARWDSRRGVSVCSWLGQAETRRRRAPTSTAVVEPGAGRARREAQPQPAHQLDGGAHRVSTAVEVAQPVETLETQREKKHEPAHQQTVVVMVAEMLEAVAVLGVVEALVLDLPAALGHAIEGAAADAGRSVGEPVGFDHLTVALMLPVAQHPHRGPAQGVPGIEVVGIPQLDPLAVLLEDVGGGLVAEALLGGLVEQRQVGLEPGDHPQP